MLKFTMRVLGCMVLTTLALLVYAAATENTATLCRDFAACGHGAPKP